MKMKINQENTKNLYLLTRKNKPYNISDDYMKIVVCALNEEEARKIFPDDKNVKVDKDGNFYCDGHYINYGWVENIMDVVVKKIGIAEDDIELNSTVISSFITG